jgi:glycosidase
MVAAALVFILSSPALPAAEETGGVTQAVESVNVTGTFNEWNPADAAYRMTLLSNQVYRLARFFRAGDHKFKFTVNGTWDKHFGVGLDGMLAQPGADIPLRVAKHGGYAVTLDVAQRQWSVVAAELDRPYAVLTAPGTVEVNLPLELDGTGSVPRPSMEILDYEFAQDTGDVVQARMTLTNAASGKATVRLPEGGKYHFTLRVNDGLFSDLDSITLVASNTYQVVGDWTTNNPNEPSASLEPVSVHIFEKILKSTEPGERLLILVRNHEEGDLIANLSVSITQTNQQLWRVRFDEESREFTCVAENDLVEFAYRPEDDAVLEGRNIRVESVAVAGTFNRWSTTANPMRDIGDGTYVTYLKLDEGLHQYKFVVNKDGWMQDPKADAAIRVEDGHGGYNSAVFIGDRGEAFGPPPPEAINLAAVRHRPEQMTYLNVVASDQADVKLRSLRGDASRVEMHLLANGKEHVLPMRRAETAFGFDFWQTSLFVDQPDTEIAYWFTLGDGKAQATVGAEPATDGSHSVKPFTTKLTVSFPTPDWAKNVVWYQIFPERFRNGSIENDPPRTVPWRWDWYKTTAWERYVDGKEFSNDWYGRRLGGDFQGVLAKLPYFRELGVTALYFCPVFESGSNHGYDTIDYRHVSQYFGHKGDNEKVIASESLDPATWQWTPSDKLFLEFVRQAHAQGLKVIVDGVFNHMGRGNFALNDVLTNGVNSAYADWFDIISWGPPVKYKSWDGGGAMPNFRKDGIKGFASASAKKYIFDITKRWMDPNGDDDPSDGVDGWRLDVAEDVPPVFWREWRQHVKSINPRAYITGEAWGAVPHHLQGDEWDAVMNYQFAMRAIHFFIDRQRKTSASQFDRQLKELLATYPMQVNFAMQNLYDSHDTDRLANMIINPDRDYDGCNRTQDGCPYNGSKPGPDAYRVMKLMATFQATFLGAPMIWYGDEVGMFGADDPTDRKPMLWKDLEPYDNPQDAVMDDVWEHYRRVIAIRNTYPPLRSGLFQTLLVDDANDVYGFTRARGETIVAVILNNSWKDQVAIVEAPWPEGTQVMDVMAANPVDYPYVRMVEAGFPQFDKDATVRTLRSQNAVTGIYAVRDGKLRVNLPRKSAAILVRR